MRIGIGSRARGLALILLAGCLLPAGARAQTETTAEATEQPSRASTGARVFDAMVVRPLTFAVLPIGVAAFIPAALTTAPNGRDSVESALELFVTTPANYVFDRPLGEF